MIKRMKYSENKEDLRESEVENAELILIFNELIGVFLKLKLYYYL
jgi:hypothetical protein